jgi:CarboxypepD_reg-like domain
LFARYAVALLLAASFARAAEIRGKVTNVIGGEPLARVQVSVLDTSLQTATSRDGTFTIRALRPGAYTLRFEAVGYRLITVPFSISSETDVKEFDVNLAPDNFRRTDTVVVRGDIFQGADPPTVSEINLTSSEIKESSTVLADDPFRAIQSLPGVSASGNNELFAEFSVAGASFDTVGIYLDDVLIPSPTHSVPNSGNGASLSLLSSETVEEMKLMMAAYPEKFGDDVGAALDIRTREGSRTRPLFRFAPGIADSEFLGEGGLGRTGKGSWLASARKSYIGWLVRNRVGPNFSDISFYDADVKLSYDVAPGQSLSLYTLGGHTNVKTTRPATSGFTGGAGDFYFSRMGWRSTINEHMVLSCRVAYMRQPLVQRYVGGYDNHQDYREWSGGSQLVWNWAKEHVFEGGWTLRRMSYPYWVGVLQPIGTIITANVNPITLHGSGYLQQSSSLFGNKLHLLGGIRYDQSERYPDHPVSPQISAALQLARTTTLHFGYGHYVQNLFPPNVGFPSSCFPGSETWQVSDHYTAAVEQRVGENTRMRVEAFTRQGADVSHLNSAPIGCSGTPFGPSGIDTFGHERSQGVQLVLQRRSSNRLSGWIGYTLVYARDNSLYRNMLTHALLFTPDYSSFEDQRHSLNAFTTYRFKPTLNISGKFLYGSGFPISSGYGPGPGGGVQLLPVQRQTPYLRVDLRADKSWAWTRWKLTLYGEVLNLTNHSNRIVTSATVLPNGQLQTTTADALPITPTTGLAFEF